jgi:diguanylate cyclase (GGDEF)-like protein/PAS domain S-box-containing protein
MSRHLSVRDIMQRDLLRCSPDTPVRRAAELMATHGRGSIVIFDGEQAVGIWTKRDAIVTATVPQPDLTQAISEVMSTTLVHIPLSASLGEAAVLCKQKKIRHLLVERDSETVGIVSQTDIVNHQGMEFYIRLREVGSVIGSTPPILPPDTPLIEVAAAIMATAQEAVLVECDGQAGVATGSDILRLIGSGDVDGTLGSVASFPLLCTTTDTSLYQARKLFRKHLVQHLGVRDHDGRLVGLLAYTDILEQIEHAYLLELHEVLEEQGRRLQENEDFLHLAEHISATTLEGVMVTDAEGHIEKVNPAFTEITGYRADEVIGQRPSVFKSGRHDRDFYDEMWTTLLRAGHWRGEIWNRRKNGEIYPQSILITGVFDTLGKPTHYIAVFFDNSERRAILRELASSRLALQTQSGLTEALLDTLPMNVFIKDEDGHFLLYNSNACETLGRPRNEVVGKSDIELFGLEHGGAMHADDLKLEIDGKLSISEYTFPLPAGGKAKMLAYKRAIDSGGRKLVIGASVDVTERHQSNQLLAYEKEVLELILRGEPEQRILEFMARAIDSVIAGARIAIHLVDDEHRYLLLASTANLPSGYAQHHEQIAIGPDIGSCGTAAYLGIPIIADDIATDPRWDGYSHIAREFGLAASWSTPIIDSLQKVLGTFAFYFDQPRVPSPFEMEIVDRTGKLAAIAIERSRALVDLHRLATLDSLTGINNRRTFMALAETEVRRARRFNQPLSVLMLDIDHFKNVNDVHGHAVGDSALIAVARSIGSQLRSFDVFGRLGGEEFAIILPGNDLASAALTAERLREQIAEQCREITDIDLNLTASFGAAALVSDKMSLDRLLANADKALYLAKENGRNRVESLE